MKLIDLADSVIIQGNIEVQHWRDGNHINSYLYRENDALSRCDFCEEVDLGDMEVVYLYSRKSLASEAWTVIEVTDEEV